MAIDKYYGAAAEYNKPSGLNFSGNLLKIIGLVLGVLALLTAAYVAFNIFTSAGRNDASRLVAREQTLLSFMTTNQANITSDDLKTINSNSVSLQTTDVRSLQKALQADYGVTSLPEDIVKTEVDTKSATTLAAAKVQSNFDQTYTQLLRSKIATAQSLATTVLNSSSGSLQQAAKTSLEHLDVIDNQLKKLTF